MAEAEAAAAARFNCFAINETKATSTALATAHRPLPKSGHVTCAGVRECAYVSVCVCACILWIHLPVRLFGMRAACAAALCSALFKRSTHMRSFSMLPFPLPRPTSPPTPSPPALILCACWQLIPLRSKHRKLSLPTSRRQQRRQRQLRFRHEDAFHNNSNGNNNNKWY